MTPKKEHHGRGLAKARSEASASPRDWRRMLHTRSDRLLGIRGRLPRRLALRVSRSVRTIIKNSGSRFVYTVQGLSIAGLAILLVIVLSFPAPGESRYDAGFGFRRSVVRERVDAVRRSRQNVSVPVMPKPSLKPRRRKKAHATYPKRLGIIETVRKKLQHFHVGTTAHVERVEIGTFKEARRIGITNIAIHPAEVNRFEVPWLLLPRVETRSFAESGHRILYSPIKEKASGGIGHGMTVLNAELSTALNLGLSYTHRLGIYGTISQERPTAIEDLFGWGVGEVPRRFIEKEVCIVERITHKQPPETGAERCPVCTAIREDSNVPVRNIVEISASLSYGCVSCHSRQLAVIDFMHAHGKNNTIFQMSPTKCDWCPKSPDFSLSYRFFYWKYWDLHENKTFGSLPSSGRKLEGQQWAPPVTRREPINLSEQELVIAIHARRGDFFKEKKRRMVPGKVFATVVKTAMDVIHKVGGVFSEMPVAVILYSEGRRQTGAIGDMHEQAVMDHEFVDTDAQVREASWFHRQLLPTSRSAPVNKTHTLVEEGGHFPNGLRVEFRISTDVSAALHEMASADVFIGSASDLSQYAVRVVSRGGMQLLPKYIGSMGPCCMGRFDERSGTVRKRKTVEDFWRMYAMANEASAERAWQEGGKD